MPKYIRTKDGITTDKLYEQALDICALTYENAQKSDLKVIDQADTIEELCDCFIGVPDREWFDKKFIAIKGVMFFKKPFELEHMYFDKNFAGLKFENQYGWEYTAQEWQDEHYFIMGCIETDKGLIYVTKMNGKGELELL